MAFLQVELVTLGARAASALADSSAPLNRNLNAYIKTLEPVKSHYLCTSIALRVEFLTTAGDHPMGRLLASYAGG